MNNQRMVEAGEFKIMVGASRSDIRLKGTVEVVGENRALDRDWRMESQAHVEPIGSLRSSAATLARTHTSSYGFGINIRLIEK
jgi:hypothetical protein